MIKEFHIIILLINIVNLYLWVKSNTAYTECCNNNLENLVNYKLHTISCIFLNLFTSSIEKQICFETWLL